MFYYFPEERSSGSVQKRASILWSETKTEDSYDMMLQQRDKFEKEKKIRRERGMQLLFNFGSVNQSEGIFIQKKLFFFQIWFYLF